MQRLPPSSHVPVQESAAGMVMEPPRPSDLRSRGLCLVPISCTEHYAGNGTCNGADLWSIAAGMAKAKATAATENKGATAMLPGGHPGHFA
uniref:Uncharacterized protein n=1 Tax=Arundo donax TaxID=35708 RepID=A0A0A9H1X8_ARUDO